MKRLFFALWPDESTRQQIDVINQKVDLAGVRKLKPSNLHVTLVFLGNVDAETQQALSAQASKIQVPGFLFQLDEMAYWREPKTVCLTVSQQPQALHELVDALVNIVKPYPIFLHDRPYCAHVTLMRKAKQDYTMEFASITWQARDFVLVESISTPDGIVYEVLERWPLAGL